MLGIHAKPAVHTSMPATLCMQDGVIVIAHHVHSLACKFFSLPERAPWHPSQQQKQTDAPFKAAKSHHQVPAARWVCELDQDAASAG